MSDLTVMIDRSVRLTRRTVDALILSLALPVMLMLLFVYLFGGAIATGGSYLRYVVPGVVLLCVTYASGQTAPAVALDLSTGIIDRFRALDVGGVALLGGHVVASLLRNIVSTGLVIGVALAIGFRTHASVLAWLGVVGLLLAFMAAISWLAAAIGLLARSGEAAAGFSFFISFIPYPSSAFVPVDTMPSWLRVVANNQPVTPVAEAVRALLLGTPVGTNAIKALVWCGAIMVVSMVASALLYRRRAA